MTQVVDMIELQELKDQFNLINEKLEKQIIINETLIKESMKRKISYVEKFHKWNFIVAALMTPGMIAIMLLYNAHWAFVPLVLAALGVEALLHYKGYRMLNPKELMVMGLIDAVERVSRFKKFFNIVTWVMFIPAFILVRLFTMGYLFLLR